MKNYLNAMFGVLTIAMASVTFANTCAENYQKTSPKSRFAINANGTVNDLATGLMWTKCAIGEKADDSNKCIEKPTIYTWDSALKAAESSAFAGHRDWRLPNIKELLSLYEAACRPSINDSVFTGDMSRVIWSSTPELFDNTAKGERVYGIVYRPSSSVVQWQKNKTGTYTYLVRTIK